MENGGNELATVSPKLKNAPVANTAAAALWLYLGINGYGKKVAK
jgi:hypothetical protein